VRSAASIVSRGAFGFAALAACDAVLLVYAWIHFAQAQPEYFATEWPTFSRVLTVQTLLYPWLAAMGGAGLFIGAVSLAAMQWQRAAAASAGRGALLVQAIAAACAAPLGIVHFFHVSITLSIDNGMHMALSYAFFFGMTILIAIDVACSFAGAPRIDAAAISRERVRAHRRAGLAVIGSALVFLAMFILKDVAWNPWQSATQKVFVVAEAVWVVLSHVYALFYIAPIRAHFAAQAQATPGAARAYARSAMILAAIAAAAAAGHGAVRAHAATAAPAAAIGGTGRIQPAGGVIVLAAPPGQRIEQVLVREGDRVKKGALLLTLADQSVRVLERDLAAERVRSAEREAVERRNAAEIELKTARLSHAQAAADVAAIEDLDERTFPAREKRTRENALAQAKLALDAAAAKLAEAKQSSQAKLRMARTQLKLAEAALAATRLTAPANATILEVHAQPGSSGGGPAVTLADTSRMYVVADFFEGDLPKLQAGQRVTVANNALGTRLEGAIERIGRVIDPVNRLAKVWVRLDKSAPADRFIGMQVDVKVEPHT
jgi:HlyD family secretion protein